MNKSSNSKVYDLEERTFKFAQECRDFVNRLPRSLTNIEYNKQLARSSGSVAANWIEANESLSKKDFSLRVKICRKEAKESRLWIKLCEIGKYEILKQVKDKLENEAYELTKIFGAIVVKSK